MQKEKKTFHEKTLQCSCTIPAPPLSPALSKGDLGLPGDLTATTTSSAPCHHEHSTFKGENQK